MSKAKTLMVVGASSSAGKSLLVTALCRIFARRGVRVAPFKAQNMSNNAAVCPDGAEIGRAQFTQALAAGITPTAAMNPLLLKPEADARSQVVVMGKAHATLPAREFYRRKKEFWSVVTDALDGLRSEYELIIIEGAGSPVELNLKAGDIVNMAVASYAQAPTLLVGDIDRGGIFPQLLGSWWLLPPEEQKLLKGFVVNKFRGDPQLFHDGVTIIEERSGIPVLGVIPYLPELGLPEEDAVALDTVHAAGSGIDIAVLQLPRIANFDDFDPLQRTPGVQLRYVRTVAELGTPDAVIIPGTKSTMADLSWLRQTGLAAAVQRLAAAGVAIVGICGGYQMLGVAVYDPDGVESTVPEMSGLSLLPGQTTFAGQKATHQARGRIGAEAPGWLAAIAGETIVGYEIHMGQTTSESRWLTLQERSGEPVQVRDGAVNADGRIWGCYIHGLFANAALREAWLRSLGWQGAGGPPDLEAALDRLAEAVAAVLDIEQLTALIESGV